MNRVAEEPLQRSVYQECEELLRQAMRDLLQRCQDLVLIPSPATPEWSPVLALGHGIEQTQAIEEAYAGRLDQDFLQDALDVVPGPGFLRSGPIVRR